MQELLQQQSLLRLLQISSPSLPVGSYAYSQGLEAIVDLQWIETPEAIETWLMGTMRGAISVLDVPILQRQLQALETEDLDAFGIWNDRLLAYRETAELRKEELDKGDAIVKLLTELDLPETEQLQNLSCTFISGYSFAVHQWQIPLRDAAQAYVWAWLENQLVSAMKIMPLGQYASQGILSRLLKQIPDAVDHGLALDDDHIGNILPALAIASAHHETQYSRLFRS